MKALTVWRPWTWAMTALPPELRKPVENRGWPMPRALAGKPVALHAGKRHDDEGALLFIREIIGWDLAIPSEHECPMGVVAVVRFAPSVQAHPSPWFVGPWGWPLVDVQPLASPVPCRGAQGLWDLPADVERRVLAQLEPVDPEDEYAELAHQASIEHERRHGRRAAPRSDISEAP